MFFTNNKFQQNTDFPIIIIYLLMFLILSIFVVWIGWLIRWLRKNHRRNRSPITNQEELKPLYKEEALFQYDNIAFPEIEIQST